MLLIVPQGGMKRRVIVPEVEFAQPTLYLENRYVQ
jgi:hypothetical protein